MFVCAIISQKGGSLKSTTAIHLAVAAFLAGYEAVVVDTDPQGTAEAWGGWRKDAPPLVIPAKAVSLPKTLERAREAGADIAFIDTPPLAQADASAAARVADLVLIPCRPRAFDLHAIRLTASLVEMTRKPAFVMLSGGHPSTTSGYDEPTEIVTALGLSVAPVHLSDRAAFHQSVMTGQAAQEIEPEGRAAAEVRAMWEWLCKQAGMAADKRTATKARRHA